MRKVIVIGATSGIGRALAVHYAKAGWQVGITGRRVFLLRELSGLFPGKYRIKAFDVSHTETAMTAFKELLAEMGDVDLIIMNAGTGHVNAALDWKIEEDCIATNVHGFAAICNVAMQYFLARGEGHLAGVSSIAGLRGIGGAPAYSASKAFVSNYLESLRGIARRADAPILVTDIQPGFVDTAMGQNAKAFWRAAPKKAACQIAAGLERKQTRIYVTKRWRLIAWIVKRLPDWAIDKIG